jgi:hypothetical protein
MPKSRPSARTIDRYRDCEEELNIETTILGSVGDPSPFFRQWRLL